MSDELVTRIDLCVDLIHQPIADFVKLVETDCLLTRARRDEQVVKRDRGGGMQIRVYSANTNAQMIIYDKVRAARAKSDYAELDHWRWGDLHPEHVTRVEFRLTNKMMRAYNRTRALGVSGNLDQFLAARSDLIDVATLDFCRFGASPPKANHSPPNHPLWEGVRTAFHHWAAQPIRECRSFAPSPVPSRAAPEHLRRSILGSLCHLAMVNGLRVQSDAELLDFFHREVNHLQNYGPLAVLRRKLAASGRSLTPCYPSQGPTPVRRPEPSASAQSSQDERRSRQGRLTPAMRAAPLSANRTHPG